MIGWHSPAGFPFPRSIVGEFHGAASFHAGQEQGHQQGHGDEPGEEPGAASEHEAQARRHPDQESRVGKGAGPTTKSQSSLPQWPPVVPTPCSDSALLNHGQSRP